MRNLHLLFILVVYGIHLTNCKSDRAIKPIQVCTNDNGELVVPVTEKHIKKFKADGFVHYSDFGAVGNGKTDDMDAIAATHAYANQQNLPVKADNGATYYIGGSERTAVIRTNTDFGTASFIIDDTDVQNRNASVFEVSSSLESFKHEGLTTLKKEPGKDGCCLAGDLPDYGY